MSDLLSTLRERVVVADGAMGTMLQAHDLSLDDFEGHEGCNEIKERWASWISRWLIGW